MMHLYRPPRKLGPEDLGLYYNFQAKVYGGSPLAPAGFHIASAADWSNIYTFYGGQATGGGPLKETGFRYWNTPNTGATNVSGLRCRGTGYRDYLTGKFAALYNQSTYWNSISVTGTYGLNNTSNAVGIGGTCDQKNGFSIICVKNDSTDLGSVTDYDGNVYPTVTVNGLVWMVGNLRVLHYNDGTPITICYDSTTWKNASGGLVCAWQDQW